MKEEMICKDLANVFNEARKMGCKKVKSFRDIPLVNVAVVIAALYKQVPKEVKNIHPAEVKETGLHILSGDCPVCGSSVPAERRYCWDCGQRLDWSRN